MHALLEYPGRGPRSPIGRAARAVTAPVRGLFWRSLKAVMLLQHRLPRRLWVSGSLEQEMLGVQGVSVCAPRGPKASSFQCAASFSSTCGTAGRRG